MIHDCLQLASVLLLLLGVVLSIFGTYYITHLYHAFRFGDLLSPLGVLLGRSPSFATRGCITRPKSTPVSVKSILKIVENRSSVSISSF